MNSYRLNSLRKYYFNIRIIKLEKPITIKQTKAAGTLIWQRKMFVCFTEVLA